LIGEKLEKRQWEGLRRNLELESGFERIWGQTRKRKRMRI